MSAPYNIKCKFCDKKFKSVDTYVDHIQKVHPELIAPNMSAWQFYYYLKTGKSKGSCIMCHKETKWNSKTKKYHRFCDNPRCKEKYKKIFQKRMIGKYGKLTLLNDPEQQKKMLAQRRISGVYSWSNHIDTSVYTGSYELDFLQFLDYTMNFDPTDVISPSPHTYIYIYEGKEHFYFPDFYVPSLNLEIEIKEGTNTHPKIMAVDKEKERLKDEVMKSIRNTVNYLKIIEKDNMKFFKYLERAKEQFESGSTSGIFMP